MKRMSVVLVVCLCVVAVPALAAANEGSTIVLSSDGVVAADDEDSDYGDEDAADRELRERRFDAASAGDRGGGALPRTGRSDALPLGGFVFLSLSLVALGAWLRNYERIAGREAV